MPQEANVKLGYIKFNVNINPGIINNDQPDYWYWKSLGFTGLYGADAPRVQGGSSALWNWTSTAGIPNLITGLVYQITKVGKEYAETYYKNLRAEYAYDPCVQLASLKNYVSGDVHKNSAWQTDFTFRSKHGTYFSIPVTIAVSGLVRTDEAKQEAWVDPTTITGILDRPKATGQYYNYSYTDYSQPVETIVWAKDVAYSNFPCS